SSKGHLGEHGHIDLTAAHGQTGNLLLDPTSIVIMGGTGDGNDTDGSSSTFQGSLLGIPIGIPGTVLVANDAPTTIFESEIEGQSATANIILDAANSITVSGSFTNGDLLLAPNSNLVLLTTNLLGAGGINLTGSTQGANLEIRTQGTGTITMTSG